MMFKKKRLKTVLEKSKSKVKGKIYQRTSWTGYIFENLFLKRGKKPETIHSKENYQLFTIAQTTKSKHSYRSMMSNR